MIDMIEQQHSEITNMGSLASTFDQVDEGVLVDSIAPKNLDRVLKELAQRYPGKQLNTTMGQANGRPAYMVQWQLSNGRIVVFTVDAQTGQVVGQ